MAEPRVPAEVFHPSIFIQDELDERGWSLGELAVRMGGDASVNLLSLEMYFEIGPDEPALLLGDHTSRQLSMAFDVSPSFFLNLHKAWRDWRLAAAGEATA